MAKGNSEIDKGDNVREASGQAGEILPSLREGRSEELERLLRSWIMRSESQRDAVLWLMRGSGLGLDEVADLLEELALLEIASPSKVFLEIGDFSGKGR